MKRKSPILIVVGICTAALAMLTLIFFITFEKKTQTAHQGGKPEIIRDEWAALARTVSAQGYYCGRFAGSADFWNENHALIFCGPDFMEDLSRDGMESLHQFMNDYGGNLIVCGLPEDLETYVGKPAGRLLDMCGISMDFPAKTGEAQEYPGDGISAGSMAIIGRIGELTVQWGDGEPIPTAGEPPFLSKGTVQGSTRWIQAAYGEGSITFCSDRDFFRNSGLGMEGHAEMLAWLLAEDFGDASVGIVDDTIAAAEKKFPWARIVFPLAVFCAALVWSRAPRFGPVRETATKERRSITERFAAEGGFLWANTPPGTLAALMRHSMRDETTKRQNAGEFIDLMNTLEADKPNRRKT